MSELQVELKIQRGIRSYEDLLVQKIEAAFTKKRGELDASQYQNLVQVALSTESPEVIKNFLRYQVGRDTKWGRGEGSLAEAIILDMQGKPDMQDDLATIAKKDDLATIAKKIAEAAGDASKAKAVHIDLIRRYLGYGKRHLTFLKPRK
jgi:hypothetical protein